MPHRRDRELLDILEKRLKLFPIVGVLGARQTGKSTLLRELLPSKRKVKYITLDRDEVRKAAELHPTLFVQGLEDEGMSTVCIDEVQKAPLLFDTLKAEIDERKYPGRFVLSGSTEFSKKTGVRESLTGRIALLRLFPMNLAEISGARTDFPLTRLTNKMKNSSDIQLKSISSWFTRGGMPGIFAIREAENRESLFEGWVETTCSRDLTKFPIPRFNPDLARRILFEIAKAPLPNRLEIARAVGRQPRQIEAYLGAFKGLFVIYEIEPYRTGVGKPLFYPFDAGLADYCGATPERCLQIWFLNECYSQFSYAGKTRPDLFFYQSTRGSLIDFIVSTQIGAYAIKLCQEESPSTYSLRAVEAFTKKNPKIPVFATAPCMNSLQLGEKICILPWTAMI